MLVQGIEVRVPKMFHVTHVHGKFEDLMKGSVTISSQNVSNVTKTRSDEDSLAESFTALKNALRDDKK